MSSTLLNGKNGRIPRGTILDAGGRPMPSARRDFQNSGGFSGGFPFPWGGGTTGYGQYGANVTKNSLAGWLWRGGDPDADIGRNVQILRERSRDAFMGIPLAAGAIETLDTKVIGTGLRPAPKVDGEALKITPEQAAALNKELAMKFDWWASDPRECDYEGKHSFYVLEHVAFQSMLLSGDCPVLFPLGTRPGGLFEFKLRVLEADRIISPRVYDPTANIFSGVELSDNGELIAYHIADRHPLSVTPRIAFKPLQTFRVEPFGALTGRRNMVLLIRAERPEQRRGVPILSVCIELLKQMGRYVDATVIGAVIQSYFTAFITSEFPDPNIFESLLNDEQKNEIFSLNPYNVQLGPGIVNFMRPGHNVEFSSPTQPPATFGDFTIAVAKFVGAAVGIPYEVLLKQYNASYSASRAALLDFWDRVKKYRALVIDQFCQPVYEEWLADAIALSRIENFSGDWNDPFVRRALLRCNWSGSTAGSLDPLKEVAAADHKVQNGFSTIEREAMELNGSDYRDNIQQGAMEKKAFEDAGLIYPPYRATVGVGGAGPPAPGGEPPGAPNPPTRGPGQPASYDDEHIREIVLNVLEEQPEVTLRR